MSTVKLYGITALLGIFLDTDIKVSRGMCALYFNTLFVWLKSPKPGNLAWHLGIIDCFGCWMWFSVSSIFSLSQTASQFHLLFSLPVALFLVIFSFVSSDDFLKVSINLPGFYVQNNMLICHWGKLKHTINWNILALTLNM